MKSVRIRSYSGPHFTVFGLNTERNGVSLSTQSECDKIRTRITPNRDTFTQCSTALLFSFLETPGWKVLHWNYINIRLYLWYWGFTKMLQTEGPCNIKNNAVNRSVGSNWFSNSIWLKKASLKNVIFKWHLVSELCQVMFWWYCYTTSCWWRMYEPLLTIFSL